MIYNLFLFTYFTVIATCYCCKDKFSSIQRDTNSSFAKPGYFFCTSCINSKKDEY